MSDKDDLIKRWSELSVWRLVGEPYEPPSDQLYGVEIEVERAMGRLPNLSTALDNGWRVEMDGSLRNGGAEFISLPMSLEDVAMALGWYYNGCHIPYEYHSNIRTGIHVHVDMRHRSIMDVLTFLTLYTIVEPALFLLCGHQREQSIYCVPWYMSDDDLANISGLLSPHGRRTYKDTARRTFIGTCKYSALYTEPLCRFGTVEFRQAPTWDNLPDTYEWLAVIDRMVRLAAEFDIPDEVIDFADSNIGDLVHDLVRTRSLSSCIHAIEDNDSWGLAAKYMRILRKPKKWVFVHTEKGLVGSDRPTMIQEPPEPDDDDDEDLEWNEAVPDFEITEDEEEEEWDDGGEDAPRRITDEELQRLQEQVRRQPIYPNTQQLRTAIRGEQNGGPF